MEIFVEKEETEREKLNRKTKLYTAIFLVFILLVGCTKVKAPAESSATSLSTPRITWLGVYLSWDKVKNADSYEIYKDGVFVCETNETVYSPSDRCEDADYSVLAVKKPNIKSELSNTVTIPRSNVAESEILDISNRGIYEGIVPADIRKLVVVPESSREIALNITIAQRKTDLIIELSNVKIVGGIDVMGGSVSRLENDFNVILEISGTVAISGNRGFEQEEPFPYDSGYNGLNGGNGGTALRLPTIVVRGEGELTVCGGDGGNGGDGAGTSSYAFADIGKGSNGGNGGDGIVTQNLIIDLSGAESKVKVVGGKGGKKGEPGVNGSIFTGPGITLDWRSYDIGKAGKSGKSITGLVTILQGKLER